MFGSFFKKGKLKGYFTLDHILPVVKDQYVLVRADLNTEVHQGKVMNSPRIEASAQTIKELKHAGAKVIILAHQGRPGKDDYKPLKQHATYLHRYTIVDYMHELTSDKAAKKILDMVSGEALLLENVRSSRDEFSPEKKTNELVTFFQKFPIAFYVNDAFSVSHREQTSITRFPKHYASVIGRVTERELRALSAITMKKSLYVLGGSKAEDNMKLLGKQRVLACGIFGQLCAMAQGVDLGAQAKFLNKHFDAVKILPQLRQALAKANKKSSTKVLIPLDFAVNTGTMKKMKRRELDREEFPSTYEIFDIGTKTQKLYTREIASAKGIYMKGPAGYCENKIFSKGTVTLLKAIAHHKGFSLIGGGHLSSAFSHAKLSEQNFSHVSLSGGALLHYVAGKKLPGLAVLREREVRTKTKMVRSILAKHRKRLAKIHKKDVREELKRRKRAK